MFLESNELNLIVTYIRIGKKKNEINKIYLIFNRQKFLIGINLKATTLCEKLKKKQIN